MFRQHWMTVGNSRESYRASRQLEARYAIRPNHTFTPSEKKQNIKLLEYSFDSLLSFDTFSRFSGISSFEMEESPRITPILVTTSTNDLKELEEAVALCARRKGVPILIVAGDYFPKPI